MYSGGPEEAHTFTERISQFFLLLTENYLRRKNMLVVGLHNVDIKLYLYLQYYYIHMHVHLVLLIK